MVGCRGYGARNPDELTEEEIDELVDTWEPEPLIPPSKVRRCYCYCCPPLAPPALASSVHAARALLGHGLPALGSGVRLGW
jgi:hypothetical protein